MPEFTHGDSAPQSGEGSPRAHPVAFPDFQAGEAANLEPVPPPTPHQEATRALNQLRAALAMHGVTFPSLGLDVVSLSQPYARPLIELGRINPRTAHLLTQALSGTDPR